MQEKIKKVLLKQLIISEILLFFIIFPSNLVNASNLKIFVIEKVGSDKILISDGSSEYLIEHDYRCSDWDFYEGGTIYIDTYYSPMYGDEIIIPGFTNKICEVTDSDNVNIKEYYVEDVFDSEDKIIVSDSNGSKYLIEYGIGCGLSMWRYEGKKIDIDVGGMFLGGIGDTIYLLDDGKDCRVWDVEELSFGDYGGNYPTNLCDLMKCPLNSSCSNGQCFCDVGYIASGSTCIKSIICPLNSVKVGDNCNCNEGYVMRDNKCITYIEDCIREFGPNTWGTKGNNNSNCYCNNDYEWNASRTACIKSVICPLNSSKINNICICNEGFVFKNGQCITHTQNCQLIFGDYVIGRKGDTGNSLCDCEAGYVWNSSRTVCIKIESKEIDTIKTEPSPTPNRPTSLSQNINKEKEENPVSNKEQIQEKSQKEQKEDLVKNGAEKQNKKGFIDSASVFLASISDTISVFLASISDTIKNFFYRILH